MPRRAAGVAVRAQGWGWRYVTRKAWAVRDLDLVVEPGERVMLLGPSGSGKSTLLAGLAGLLDPGTPDDPGPGDEEGRLLVDGVPAVPARRRSAGSGLARTGLLLQDPLAQTVLARSGDDVAFGLENHAVAASQIWPRVDAALNAVHFPYGRDRPTSRLSGGERQRLALAGVLALRPGLLLLDEPTAMLDDDGATALREQVAGLLADRTRTCLLVEHRVGAWLDLVDRIAVLDPAGGVLADGTPDQVLGAHGSRLAEQGVWVPGLTPLPLRPPSSAVPSRPGPGGSRTGDAGPGGSRSGGAGPGGVVSGTVLLTAQQVGAGRAVGGRPGVSRRRFGRRPRTGPDTAIVQGVDLQVRAGEATCLVGPNGVGKSTLALVLGGLTAPLSGRLVAAPALAAGAGDQPHRWRPRELVTRIGTVFQEPQHQFVTATVHQELLIGPLRVGVPQDQAQARANQLLHRLQLDRLARAHPFTLSGGEQRRLSVATALVTRPPVLVLDEPTFGQDARTWAELVGLLLELLDGGCAIVAATHDQALVEALAGTVVRLGPRQARSRPPQPSPPSLPLGEPVG